MNCLDQKTLSSYLDESLSESERSKINKHIAECSLCLDLLLVAYEARRRSQRCPPLLKQRVKKTLDLKQKKARPEARWLFGTLLLFALSFAFKRFFLQFLIAAAILGFKWVMEGEGAKRVVMIFRGIKNEGTSLPKSRVNSLQTHRNDLQNTKDS